MIVVIVGSYRYSILTHFSSRRRVQFLHQLDNVIADKTLYTFGVKGT